MGAEFEIVKQESIEMEYFGIHVLSDNILICSRRIQYLIYHIDRCKKEEDKIKLITMCFVNIAHIGSCAVTLGNIKEKIIKKLGK